MGGGAPPTQRPVDVHKIMQGTVSFSNSQGQSVEAHLEMFQTRCEVGNVTNDEDKARAFFLSLAGEPARWLTGLAGWRTMSWAELRSSFVAHWAPRVRSEAAEARLQLHAGRHAMQPHEKLITYNLRFRRLMALCDNMAESDRILFYQTGLHRALHTACVVDSNGQEFTTLDSLMQWAVGQEQRLVAQRVLHQGRGGRFPVAAMRVQMERPETDEAPAKKPRTEQLAAASKHKPPPSPPAGGKVKVGKGKGPTQQPKAKPKPPPSRRHPSWRTAEWREDCRKYQCCMRCGSGDHYVRDCPESEDYPQPGERPKGGASTSRGSA